MYQSALGIDQVKVDYSQTDRVFHKEMLDNGTEVEKVNASTRLWTVIYSLEALNLRQPLYSYNNTPPWPNLPGPDGWLLLGVN